MTDHDQTTTETRLILPPINYAAPGSRQLEIERRRFAGAYQEAVSEYNETIDDLNDAREAVIANPDPTNLDAHTALKHELARHKAEQKRLDEAREAYHQHLIGRMTTNDGTSVDEALRFISYDDFLALCRSDVESVAIPKPSATSSSGG